MNTIRLAMAFGFLVAAASDAVAQLRPARGAAPPPTIPPILPSTTPPILPAPTLYPAQIPNNMLPAPNRNGLPFYRLGGYYGGYFPFYSYDYGPYDNSYPTVNYNTINNYYLPEAPPRNFAVPPPIGNDRPDIARLTLQVPTGSEVTINGKKYDVAGSRTFESPELRQGDTYTFDVRVTWTERGKTVEEKRTLTMRAGDLQSLQYLALPASAVRVAD